MIDSDGYRSNVGIILCNTENKVLWARRIGQNAWQFPQGGIKRSETPEEALYRELWEEVGVTSQNVELLAATQDWLRYRLPKALIRCDEKPLCVGQKQLWFLLRFSGTEDDVRLDCGEKPEFDGWRWVDYWHPLKEVVAFKRDVYLQALNEFAPVLGCVTQIA
ncbi:MAG: RNA pyrophosphohydrolase [Gammaproteobacteria bacterium]|nr:RNA pyrophosphohydrolase [Gammaproteobacteria bacterium]